MDEDRLSNIERAVVELKTIVEQRFDAVDRRFEQVDQRFEQVDRRFEETQAQLKALIEDVRDDIRIVVEGHIALEKRVTALERRPL